MRAHNWMMTHWKPASAFVYTLICLCDFVIFPAYAGLNRLDLTVLIDQIQGMDVGVQNQIIAVASQGYSPFTLRGSGLFHLAFGALLTGAAINAGEKGLFYGKDGAEFRRRKEDDGGGYQPKPGSDPGPPPRDAGDEPPKPDAPKPQEPDSKK